MAVAIALPAAVVSALRTGLRFAWYGHSALARPDFDWADTAMYSGALVAVLFVPLFEGLRPRSLAVGRLLAATGFACAGVGIVMLLTSLVKTPASTTMIVLAILGAAFSIAAGCAGLVGYGAYIGALPQSERVRWLLVFTVAQGLLGSTWPFLLGRDPVVQGACFVGAGAVAAIAGLIVKRQLPGFGTQEAPAESIGWWVTVRAALGEARRLPGGVTCLVTLIVLALPTTAAYTLGTSTWDLDGDAITWMTIASGTGWVLAWFVLLRNPPQRVLWVSALTLVAAAAAWGLAAPLGATAAVDVGCALTTGASSGFTSAVLLVLTFRVFGAGRFYLSLYAAAAIAPTLVTWPLRNGLVRLLEWAGAPTLTAVTVSLCLLAALWALIARGRMTKALHD